MGERRVLIKWERGGCSLNGRGGCSLNGREEVLIKWERGGAH